MSDGIDSIRRLVPLLRELRARINANKPADDQIKIEQIDEVLGNGHYVVQGSELSTTGSTPLRAGQQVAVAHVQGKRLAIFSHEEAKAKFPVTPLPAGGAILEELFVGTDSQGRRDIYYRNQEQVKALSVHATIPVAETIVDMKFIDAYPQTGDVMAKPDVRTLFLVRTSSGAFTADPSSPGTRVVKFYVFRLVGKVANKAQIATISKATLVRVESTASMTELKLLDWDFNFTQQQTPLRLNRWRNDTINNPPPDSSITPLGVEEAVMSTNVAHAHRTITMAQAIPGFISTFFEEFVQAHVRDAWLDPRTGHTLAFMTLAIAGMFPAHDPAVGDTGSRFSRTVAEDEAGTISAETVSGAITTGINIAPEAHAMIVDVTDGVVLWTTMGSVVKSFLHSIEVTGYLSLTAHVAFYTDGVFDNALVFATPPNVNPQFDDLTADFEDTQVGSVTEPVLQSDGFSGDSLFDHSEMYATTGPTPTTTKATQVLSGGTVRLTLTVTRSTKSKVKSGRVTDLRLLRWRASAADRRLWAVLVSDSGLFSTRIARPVIIDGTGVVLGAQPSRRLFVQPTGSGSFQEGFIRMLSASESHVMFRALLGVSDVSNAPRDSVTLAHADPAVSGLAVQVIDFPLTESQSPSSTGTVTWTTHEGSFSQIEAALPFFSEHLIRLVRRDFALATREVGAVPPVPGRAIKFILAWNLTTEVPTLNALVPTFPVEDGGMAAFKAMKKIPASIIVEAEPQVGEIITPLTSAFGGLVRDTNSIRLYASDWRVINDQGVLKGRWKKV